MFGAISAGMAVLGSLMSLTGIRVEAKKKRFEQENNKVKTQIKQASKNQAYLGLEQQKTSLVEQEKNMIANFETSVGGRNISSETTAFVEQKSKQQLGKDIANIEANKQLSMVSGELEINEEKTNNIINSNSITQELVTGTLGNILGSTNSSLQSNLYR